MTDLPGGIVREGLAVLAMVGGPFVAALLIVGVVVGLLQAATQINDPAVGFLPRLLTAAAVLWGVGGWAIERLARFLGSALERMAPAPVNAMAAWAPLLVGFLLVLFRTAGLCSVAPILGARTVPARVRLALALTLALTAWSAAGAPAYPAWDRTALLAGAVFRETLIGLAAGLGARLAIDAALAAGSAVAMAMGIGFGSMIDPLHGNESSSVSELLSLAALASALSLGLHREAVAWLCRSVIATPPGTAISIPELASAMVGDAARAAAFAARLAMPALAAVTLGHATLGVLSRSVPQLGLGNVGFGVALLAGGGALYLIAPGIAELAAEAARTALLRR